MSLDHVQQGIVDARAVAGGFRVELGRHRPAVDLQAHAHAFPNLLFVLSGSFEQAVGQRIFSAGAGTVIEKDAGVVHSDRFGQAPSTILYLEVLDSRLDELRDVLHLFDRPRSYFAPQARALAMRLGTACRSSTAGGALLVEALALQLILELAASRDRRAATARGALGAAIELIETQLAPPPRMEELSTAAGLPAAQLIRMFRDRLGETPLELIRRRRLEDAARRLATGSEPICAIAHDLGFADQAHFTRWFRRTFAVTPGEYRRSFSNRDPRDEESE